MKTPWRALVRKLPSAYTRATSEHPVSIDLELARVQHNAYVSALSHLIDEIIWAETLDNAADSVFVEDQAVVGGEVGLMTRSGLPSRRVESTTVGQALEPYLHLEWMSSDATLDGGDVLRLGRTFFVGQSARTNRQGFEELRSLFRSLGYAAHPVPVLGDLHLKCVCSAIREDLVVAVTSRLPKGLFEGVADVIQVPESEAYGANLLSNGHRVVMADGCPVTQRAVEARGLEVQTLDLSEIRKGDGALTCMSVWF